jgi:hypothetical protein
MKHFTQIEDLANFESENSFTVSSEIYHMLVAGILPSNWTLVTIIEDSEGQEERFYKRILKNQSVGRFYQLNYSVPKNKKLPMSKQLYGSVRKFEIFEVIPTRKVYTFYTRKRT